MLARCLLALAALTAVVAVTATRASSEEGDSQKKPPAMTPEMVEMMKKMQKYMTPGEHHKKLARYVGEYKTTTRFWMAGPKGPGSKPEQGKATFKWLFPGRWLSIQTSGTLMGMPVKGFGILGYDNYKKKYVMTWVDSINTMMLDCQGQFDREEKNLALYGLMDEPTLDEHDKMVKYAWRTLSEDKFLFDIHDLAIGEKNNLVVRVEYERVK